MVNRRQQNAMLEIVAALAKATTAGPDSQQKWTRRYGYHETEFRGTKISVSNEFPTSISVSAKDGHKTEYMDMLDLAVSGNMRGIRELAGLARAVKAQHKELRTQAIENVLG